MDLSRFLPSDVKITMMHEFSEEFSVKHKGSLSWPFNLYTGQDFYFVQPFPPRSDIIAVNKADKVLSFYYNYGKSRVVLWPQMKQNKVRLVKYAIDHLVPELVGVPKPPWVDGVMFHDEQTLRTQINDNQLKIDGYQKWKILLYSTGWQLAEVVKEALNLLGVRTDDPATKPGDPRKRYDHDLEIQLPTDLTGIVEVTGSTGAIDVDKVRQLMDYVTTVEKEEPERKIKGILIGNSHREKSPSQRDAAFTEKAVERAFQNEFCLYTTAELYKTLESAQKGQRVTDRLSKILSEGKGCATK